MAKLKLDGGRVYQTNHAPRPEPLSTRNVSRETLREFYTNAVVELSMPGKYKRYLCYDDTAPDQVQVVANLHAQLGAGVTLVRCPKWNMQQDDVHYFLPDEGAYALFDLITYFGD